VVEVTRLVIVVTIVALIAGMVGCGQPAQYTLNISSTEGGEVATPSEMTSSYDEGAEVPLVALPHTGHCFVNWTGDVDTIANVNAASTTVTMSGDYSITANFVVQYVLTIDSEDGGSVADPGEGTFLYDEGAVVVLGANPDVGYRFVNWSGNVGSISDVNATVTTITMDTDCAVTATFEEDELVTFVDPYLEAEVRQTIDILERPIYARDMERLTHLDAEHGDIYDLTGLEYATRLTRLNLDDNQVSDTSPLTDLNTLTELNLITSK
jgi:Leucine-rich repeat (LRR) protein